jgi:hypothetical protein
VPYTEEDVHWPDESVEKALVKSETPPIVDTLGFPIAALLTFVPDVRLKQKLDRTAADALAIDVTTDDGLRRADAALADIRTQQSFISDCFEEPTGLANQLHKRMTGLRSDFCKAGTEAAETLRKRILAEKRRRDAVADEMRRKAQEIADRQARELAKELAKEAKADGAPKEVVKTLQEQAKIAAAPPVAAPIARPVLQNSATVDKWRVRLVGTPEDAEPNPEIDEMSESQQAQVREIFGKIATGEIPLTAALGLNWSYLNRRAQSEKTTFKMHNFEAYNEGGLRSRRR